MRWKQRDMLRGRKKQRKNKVQGESKRNRAKRQRQTQLSSQGYCQVEKNIQINKEPERQN